MTLLLPHAFFIRCMQSHPICVIFWFCFSWHTKKKTKKKKKHIHNANSPKYIGSMNYYYANEMRESDAHKQLMTCVRICCWFVPFFPRCCCYFCCCLLPLSLVWKRHKNSVGFLFHFVSKSPYIKFEYASICLTHQSILLWLHSHGISSFIQSCWWVGNTTPHKNGTHLDAPRFVYGVCKLLRIAICLLHLYQFSNFWTFQNEFCFCLFVCLCILNMLAYIRRCVHVSVCCG